MEQLIRPWFILLKCLGNGRHVLSHSAGIDIGHEVGNFNARLNLVGVGVLNDREDLVGGIAPRPQEAIEQGLHVVRRIINCGLLLLGTGGYCCAAGNEQHDDDSFHIGFVFLLFVKFMFSSTIPVVLFVVSCFWKSRVPAPPTSGRLHQPACAAVPAPRGCACSSRDG